jgi:hypothetical protein
MTYTYAPAAIETSQEVYGVHPDMNNVAINSIFRNAYEVIVPMTTFNIFARIR